MEKIKIIAAIRLATGKSVEQVAAEHGYTRMTFYRAINNAEYATKPQQIIAEIIGKPVDELWPENQKAKEAA